MKTLVIVAAVVALVQGRPETGYSYSKPLSRPIVVLDDAESGHENTEIQKHFYVHAPSPEPTEFKPQKPITVPSPEKHYKLVFIKAPTPPTPTTPKIPIIPQNEEKTLVYVLSQKREDPPEVVIPTAAPTQPAKPEVYFIKYDTKKENKNFSSGNNGGDYEYVIKSYGSEAGSLIGGSMKIDGFIGGIQRGSGNGEKHTENKQSATSTHIYKVPNSGTNIERGIREGHRNAKGRIQSDNYTRLTGRPTRVGGYSVGEKFSDTSGGVSGRTASTIRSISSGNYDVSTLNNYNGRVFIDHTSGRRSHSRSHGRNIKHGKDNGIGLIKGGVFGSSTGGGYSGSRENFIKFGNDEKFSAIQKHIYVHVPPPEPTEYRPRKPITFAPPEKHYKLIFIKAPTPPTPTAPLIPVIPQNEEKTLVYVLHKKPEDAPEIFIPTAAPTQPAKPEVHFIRYKSQKEGDDRKDSSSPSESYGPPGLQGKTY